MRLIACLTIYLMFTPISSPAAELSILQENSSTRLPIPVASNIHYTNKKVIKIIDQGSYLQILAKKQGESFITSNNKSYQIIVLKKTTHAHYLRFKEFLLQKKGLKLEVNKNYKLVISGTLFRLSDWKELALLASANNINFHFKARIEPYIAKKVLKFLESIKKNNSLKNINFKFSSTNTISLTAPEELKSKLAFYQNFFLAYGLQVQLDNQLISVQPLIRMRVILAEVNKNFRQVYGFDWDNQFQVQVLPGFASPASFMSTIKSLETQGHGKIIASPTLICRSGGSAEFLAGGEIPIRIISRNKKSIHWKRHGIFLSFKPIVDSKGQIRFDITTEISMPDGSKVVEGIPAMKTSRMKSQIDLKESKTIVLSGLIKQHLSNSDQGLALLKKIPILGSLFKSSEYQKNETELFVFVTPEIVPELSPKAMPAIDSKFRAEP